MQQTAVQARPAKPFSLLGPAEPSLLERLVPAANIWHKSAAVIIGIILVALLAIEFEVPAAHREADDVVVEVLATLDPRLPEALLVDHREARSVVFAVAQGTVPGPFLPQRPVQSEPRPNLFVDVGVALQTRR